MALAILNGPFVLIFRALNNGFPTILDKGLDHTGYNPVLLHRALGKEAIMAKWTVPMRSQARYTTLACRMLVEADHIRYHPNQIKLLKANRTLSLLLQERCDDLFLTTALFHHQNYNIISSPSSIIKDLSTNNSSFLFYRLMVLFFNHARYPWREGGITLWITPPYSVITKIENPFTPYKSASAYLNVPVISVYPSR